MRTEVELDASARPAAGTTGIAAAVLMVAAPMAGTSDVAMVVWITALLLLIPFCVGLAAALADGRGKFAWLTPAIPVGASIAVALQLVVAGVGEVANHVAKSSPVHEPLHDLESALFGLTLIPLGVAVAAAALTMRNHQGFPRWLTYATAVVALALLGNGMVIGTEQLPAMLAFLIWTVACGVALTRRARIVGLTPQDAAVRV